MTPRDEGGCAGKHNGGKTRMGYGWRARPTAGGARARCLSCATRGAHRSLSCATSGASGCGAGRFAHASHCCSHPTSPIAMALCMPYMSMWISVFLCLSLSGTAPAERRRRSASPAPPGSPSSISAPRHWGLAAWPVRARARARPPPCRAALAAPTSANMFVLLIIALLSCVSMACGGRAQHGEG